MLGGLDEEGHQRVELRFRGKAIATALGHYAEATPVGRAPLPKSLDELLADHRFPTPRRHLRQLYADPFTGKPDWEPVIGQAAVAVDSEGAASAPAASGIVGVRSRSSRRLFATVGGRTTARDWVFSSPATAPSPP